MLWIATFASVFVWQRKIVHGFLIFRRAPARAMSKLRPVAFNLTKFGAVGDGVTMNTEACEKAVLAISKLRKKRGEQLNELPSRRGRQLGSGTRRPSWATELTISTPVRWRWLNHSNHLLLHHVTTPFSPSPPSEMALLSFPFAPLLRSSFGSQSAAVHSVRMEGNSSATVPSIFVYVTVPSSP